MKNDNPFVQARQEKNKNGFQSIEEVAEATNISKSTIYDLESGKARGVNYKTVAILAKHYGVSMDYLCGNSLVSTVDANIRMICEYTGLSQSAVEALDRHRRELSPFGTKALNTIFESGEFDEIIERLATYLFGYSLEMIPIDLPAGALSGRDSYPITDATQYKNLIQPAQLVALGACLANIEKQCEKKRFD